jgi:N-acetylglucosaminyl-diphospho-decaprenol L-rhamnosyltransferase
VTVVVVTLASATRMKHVANQLRFVRQVAPDAGHVVVWLDETPAPDVPALAGVTTVHVPPGPDGLRLAAGRNRGADAAVGLGATLVVFLDADCVPGPDLFRFYEQAALDHPGALLSGPVTYLPEGFVLGAGEGLEEATAPHAARPAPPAGSTVVADAADYPLFWSLSFAVTPDTWARLGGFDERYEGYGGEDTDFAFTARSLEVPLVWVGGAHAYHQYHPTSSPPWRHLADVVRNGGLFADRWGEWPMGGWLDAFEQAGAVRRTTDGGWALVEGASAAN